MPSPRDAVHPPRSADAADAEPAAVLAWSDEAAGEADGRSAWARLTGQAREEVGDGGWLEALHPDDRPGAEAAWAAARDAGAPFEHEYRVRTADGEYRWMRAHAVPLRGEDGRVRSWAGTLRDVHARRTAEAERDGALAELLASRREAEALADTLGEQAAELQEQVGHSQALARDLEVALHEAESARDDEARLVDTLHRIGVALTSETELHAIVQAATDEATALTGARFGAFFYNVLDGRGGSYQLYTIAGVPPEAFSRFPMPRNTAVFGPTFRGEGPVRSDDITADPRYGRNPPHHGMPPGHLPVRSYLAVPVLSRTGEVLGGLFFGHEARGVFTARAERVAAGIAGWAAVAIDNARLHEAERGARAQAERAADRARRLLDVAAALSGAASAAEVGSVAVETGLAAIGADAGSLALLDADGTAFETVATRGYPADLQARFLRFPLHAGRPFSDAALTGEPVLLNDWGEWEARYPEMAAHGRESGYPAYAAAPVVSGGRVLGVLGFSFHAPQSLDGGVAVFLRTLAGYCASALERARLYEAERAARAEAETANRAKSQFLAAMSHELRTPLNAIGGYVELIELGLRGPVTEEQRADLERIRRAQHHLLGLINDVLNFAKLEAGRIDVHVRDVPLGPVLDEVEALIAPQAASRGIAYVQEGAEPAMRVRADGEKLEQILLNLLSNAVKFTDEGGRVSVAWEEDGDDVRIHVRDTGTGIPEEKLPAVFEPFVQVDPNLTRTRQGTGLGLAISRELARAMGGDLTAQSRVGEGSTFTVHLRRGDG